MTALPSFREALRVWAWIGCVNFGGPAGQIALMHRVLVEEKKWISEARYFHALNYCMLLPGPEAQQLATYIGWLMHGVRGGLAAGLLFILPGALVMLALSLLYALNADAPLVQDLFFGIKAAVLAIVIDALIRISKRALTGSAMTWIAAGAFLALFAFAVPFPLIVLAAALTGFFGAQLVPDQFRAGAHGPGNASEGADHALDLAFARGGLAHTRTTPAKTLGTIATWLCIWLLPVGALLLLSGPDDVYATMAVFFSKMSVVTFGGAYAVLSYVAQEAVQTYQWMTAREMIHGLALAETTPGPLILVLQHVGFLAGFRNGASDPVLAGLLGAFITLWVTFAPSFLWIFAGAPYAERVRDNKRISAALAAITAAVVGVILNLCIWFALHALFGQVTTQHFGPLQLHVPALATLDPLALVMTIAASVALLRFRMPIVPLLALSGILGLIAHAVQA